METKSLLYGLIGFFLGGLIVSVAATSLNAGGQGMAMEEMVTSLESQKGDDYDAAFLRYMIEHHQAAVDMAVLSADRAEHEEIRQLSREIIEAQEREIHQMRQWQEQWGYPAQAGHGE